MELRKLKYFLATAEELHFRRAADIVHVTQPALSKQIHELEEEIGVMLFERNNRNVALTPAGKVFYARARVIVDSTRNAMNEARGIGDGLIGTVRIGFISSAALRALPEALTQFRNKIPTAEIELKELGPEEQMDELQRGHLDVGLLIAQVLDEGFEVAEVDRSRLIAALPATPEFIDRMDVSLKELCSQTIIVPFRHSRYGYYETVMEAYLNSRVKPARIQTVRMIQTALILVRAGQGVSLVPELFSNDPMKGVVYRPLRDSSLEIALSVTWRTENMSPLVQEFIKVLVNSTH